jgi:hypothetical protein
MNISQKLAAWHHARSTSAEENIFSVDAEGARTCGLHTLAALIELQARVEAARGPMSGAEISSFLAPIIMTCRGEAETALQRQYDDPGIVVPGLRSFPGGARG